jgi:hypothetical protein
MSALQGHYFVVKISTLRRMIWTTLKMEASSASETPVATIKFILEETIKAQRGSGGVALLFL